MTDLVALLPTLLSPLGGCSALLRALPQLLPRSASMAETAYCTSVLENEPWLPRLPHVQMP